MAYMKYFFTCLFVVFFTTSFAQDSGNSPISKKELAPVNVPGGIPQAFSIQKMYPNPAKDVVKIDLRVEVAGNFQITLFNILGTEVKKWEPSQLFQGDQQMVIDLSSIKTGMYVIKVSGSGQVYSQVLKKV